MVRRGSIRAVALAASLSRAIDERKNMPTLTILRSDLVASAPASATRADFLADRLELGARALADFASTFDDAQWQRRVPKDGRKIGVTVHHVASMYPLE